MPRGPGPGQPADLLSCHSTITERAYHVTVSSGLPRSLSRSASTTLQRPWHAGIAARQALCPTAAPLPPRGQPRPALPAPAPKPLPPGVARRPPGMDTRGSSRRVTVPGPNPSYGRGLGQDLSLPRTGRNESFTPRVTRRRGEAYYVAAQDNSLCPGHRPLRKK